LSEPLNTDNKTDGKLKYLDLLSKQFPTVDEASTEIINLQAILNLPKGTEHFLSDIHGEYEPFVHVLKNASGVIKKEIEKIFGTTLTQNDKKSLATLIYYPEQKLDIILKKEKNIDDWYRITLYRLIEVCRSFSSKYTRSKVRKAMPKNFTYILEELLHTQDNAPDKYDYYSEIINTIIDIQWAGEFITALSRLIQRLAIDRLHILGDTYDRGPGADIIMDTLVSYHSVDIQWGNHDILWMGAASGQEACIANVLRICARYANLDTIEDGYGINLLPLATFAMEFYKNDPCLCFKPKVDPDAKYDIKELNLIAQMHKAVSIIQFKLEKDVISRHPEFQMDDRLLLDKIDYKAGTVTLGKKTYELLDKNFPTVDPQDPCRLLPEEKELMEKLRFSFSHSEKLEKHIRFMYSNGSLYKVYNSNLLFHGCVPLSEDGGLKKVTLCGNTYSGRELFDYLDIAARKGYFGDAGSEEKKDGEDLMWYLWAGPDSPVFGKEKMATFERYFIREKETHAEKKTPYYTHRDDEKICCRVLREFGLDPAISHIINGHVPVEQKNGESPIKAGGKLFVIDGGFARAYQKTTGIAGYTLIYDSYGLTLVSHQYFKSTEAAIVEETDILSSSEILERASSRKKVRDTDIGVELQEQIKDLKQLLSAYRRGLIKEKTKKPS
jgi:fructose-1,6-bisphosphatase-3